MAEKKNESQASSSTGDKIFSYDEEAIDKLRSDAPWKKDVKHFKNCKVSALAAMKMLKHALAGVDKGRKAGTNPIEVMGLLVGKPEGDTVIIMDTCPLPVEGTETKVVADDCQSYMIDLLESMEYRRKDRFVGWYHSHPFDVETYSHCHLSGTDVQTQYLWQAQSPFWVAIVVDPLRSLARQEPEFGCFRCYPADHNPPKNECPDGSNVGDEKSRVVRWGVTPNRYYSLEISYFMSSLGNSVLTTMSKNSLWIRVLSSSAVMEQENRDRFSDRVKNAATKIDAASRRMPTTRGVSGPSLGSGKKNEALEQVTQACTELALEQVKGHMSQITKAVIFNVKDESSESSSSS